jgi:signal recognition particle GTPase
LEKSKLKEKYFDEIETNILNYYLNIEDVNQIVKELNTKTKTKKNKIVNNNKKITEFFCQL